MRTILRLGAIATAVLVVGSSAPALAAHPQVRERTRGYGSAKSVVALIDTGINPYSKAFRDRSKLAGTHPSKYIRGFPKNAKALQLSLNLPYKKAVKKDAKVWATVQRGKLYWIPGTRIAGAISLGAGGTNCPVIPAPPANSLNAGCEEHILLDDHGHGTMTASRAAGSPRSLAPKARIVEIEGLGAQSTRWAAEQGWIDVQSNSWISLVPPPIPSAVSQAFSYASTRMLTLAASGNGTAYLAGGAPTPTYLLSTAPAGVVLVGGHDNGKVTAWAGAPPHIVADAYAGQTALAHSTSGMRPDPMACCTSAASPYAAGGAAAIVLEARRLLNDGATGAHGGLVSCGHPGNISKGPLADGAFTLRELKQVLFRTAEIHPGEGRHDGLVHWAGDPRPPDYTEYGVGANPFCAGCTTMPVEWSALPNEADTYQFTGYGGINERSLRLAKKVLRGDKALPERATADAQYELDQEIRRAEFSLNDFGEGRTETAAACAVVARSHHR